MIPLPNINTRPVKKLCIVISTNRAKALHPSTIKAIEDTKTQTIFIKQNLPACYKNHPYITEILTQQNGLSNGRNLGVKIASAKKFDYIAFTDDDCVITRSWINHIYSTFADTSIGLIFGKTLPYQPSKHPNQFCPCTFSPKKNIPHRVTHLAQIGYGNNFAITHQSQLKIGLFNPLFGAGTPVFGGEDTDFFIRAISLHLNIVYQPKMILYHNRWLNESQQKTLNRHYTFSFSCIHFWNYLHGNKSCLSILRSSFHEETDHYLTYLKLWKYPIRCLELIIKQNWIIIFFLAGIARSVRLKLFRSFA